MSPGNDNEYSGVLAGFIIFVLVLVLVPVIWLAVVFNVRHRQCVRLDNGLMLGYAAVFDLGRPLFRPIVVPKYWDGTPLVHNDVFPLYVSDTTLYGTVKESGVLVDYAWREDTGLVSQAEAPALYDRLVAEAGAVNRDVGSGWLGAGIVFQILAESPANRKEHCLTRLITW